MIQLVPQLKILLAYEPVDFRKGIDSLVALCKTRLDQDLFSGALFVFRNRSGTALNMLKTEKTTKLDVRAKLLKAAWDNNYLLKILCD